MKKYEPQVKDWEAVRFLVAMPLASVFVFGCEAGRDDAAKARKLYAGNLKNATESSRV